MLQTIKLLLPALIPSWRFFDTIAPSPRIEFITEEDNWREFRPRPERLAICEMLKHMVWNPHWNDSLFLVSCAERLMENPTEHSIQEIRKRIEAETDSATTQFRLVYVRRNGAELYKEVTYVSPIYKAGV